MSVTRSSVTSGMPGIPRARSPRLLRDSIGARSNVAGGLGGLHVCSLITMSVDSLVVVEVDHGFGWEELLPPYGRCHVCDGEGRLDGPCPGCEGSGQVRQWPWHDSTHELSFILSGIRFRPEISSPPFPPPIAAVRGLPADLSASAKHQFDHLVAFIASWGQQAYLHGLTWLFVNELLDYDWTRPEDGADHQSDTLADAHRMFLDWVTQLGQRFPPTATRLVLAFYE